MELMGENEKCKVGALSFSVVNIGFGGLLENDMTKVLDQ
jgi:hypothetical protein